MSWNLTCNAVAPVLTTKTTPAPTLPEGQSTQTVEPVKPPSYEIQRTELQATTAEVQNTPVLAAANTLQTPEKPDYNTEISVPLDSVIVNIELETSSGTANPAAAKDTNTPDGIPIEFDKLESDTNAQIQPAPVVITTPSNGSSIVSVNPVHSKGFSGSISVENRSFRIEDTSLKFNVGYKPIIDSYWFVRTGLNISQESQPFTYSWGIGYDDWHPGTWGIQLNHWGPLSPGDGFDIENAVAEISYKLKGHWLTKNNLASTVALSSPVSGDPSLSWGWSWNPYSHWFIRSTLIKPIGTGDINWSYGFGYTRYNANSLSIEYNNWGVNDFPDHNFRENGQLSLIYRWAF